ncbi:carboxypeptidase regulatory-like domain-containing protein [Oculatella sp. LEGE 06141]|nr:carboxypeptidase regulatory-like domain-containing protein [Oculatella sp. LEGE 06141]
MILLGLLSVLGVQSRAIAHGVEINYQTTEAIAINATYDTGEPMAEAQVIVYAPDDPSTPWMTGTTDEQGRFLFAPDRAQSGNWEVAVRQAGHGEILSIPVDGEAASETEQAPAPSSETAAVEQTAGRANNLDALSPLQKGVMGGAVLWGFIGTALFFARGKK